MSKNGVFAWMIVMGMIGAENAVKKFSDQKISVIIKKLKVLGDIE